MMAQPSEHDIGELIGHQVVLDVTSTYVYLGRFVEQRGVYLILEDVDVHDLRDVPTTRERYVHDSRLQGVRTNRKRVWVALSDVVSLSRLIDVVIE